MGRMSLEVRTIIAFSDKTCPLTLSLSFPLSSEEIRKQWIMGNEKTNGKRKGFEI